METAVEAVHPCSTCSSVFQSQNGLNQHIMNCRYMWTYQPWTAPLDFIWTLGSTTGTTYSCSSCSDTFYDYARLCRHMSTHAQPKPSQQCKCPVEFQAQRRHDSVHSMPRVHSRPAESLQKIETREQGSWLHSFAERGEPDGQEAEDESQANADCDSLSDTGINKKPTENKDSMLHQQDKLLEVNSVQSGLEDDIEDGSSQLEVQNSTTSSSNTDSDATLSTSFSSSSSSSSLDAYEGSLDRFSNNKNPTEKTGSSRVKEQHNGQCKPDEQVGLLLPTGKSYLNTFSTSVDSSAISSLCVRDNLCRVDRNQPTNVQKLVVNGAFESHTRESGSFPEEGIGSTNVTIKDEPLSEETSQNTVSYSVKDDTEPQIILERLDFTNLDERLKNQMKNLKRNNKRERSKLELTPRQSSCFEGMHIKSEPEFDQGDMSGQLLCNSSCEQGFDDYNPARVKCEYEKEPRIVLVPLKMKGIRKDLPHGTNGSCILVEKSLNQIKRPRGRPKGSFKKKQDVPQQMPVNPCVKRKRGRPRKNVEEGMMFPVKVGCIKLEDDPNQDWCHRLRNKYSEMDDSLNKRRSRRQVGGSSSATWSNELSLANLNQGNECPVPSWRKHRRTKGRTLQDKPAPVNVNQNNNHRDLVGADENPSLANINCNNSGAVVDLKKSVISCPKNAYRYSGLQGNHGELLTPFVKCIKMEDSLLWESANGDANPKLPVKRRIFNAVRKKRINNKRSSLHKTNSASRSARALTSKTPLLTEGATVQFPTIKLERLVERKKCKRYSSPAQQPYNSEAVYLPPANVEGKQCNSTVRQSYRSEAVLLSAVKMDHLEQMQYKQYSSPKQHDWTGEAGLLPAVKVERLEETCHEQYHSLEQNPLNQNCSAVNVILEKEQQIIQAQPSASVPPSKRAATVKRMRDSVKVQRKPLSFQHKVQSDCVSPVKTRSLSQKLSKKLLQRTLEYVNKSATLSLNNHQCSTSKSRFRCTVCGQTNTWKWNHDRHMLVHQDTKKYKCKNCGTSFKYSDGLERHERKLVCLNRSN